MKRESPMKFKKVLESVYPKLERKYRFQGHLSFDKKIDLENAVGGRTFLDGFWTSTIYKEKDKFMTKWTKLINNDLAYGPTNESEGYFHLYTIVNNPNIYHVNSENKAEKFLDKYHRESKKGVKWEKISKKFDAVHLLEGGLENEFFKLFNVESTIWFRPKDHLKEQFVWKMEEKDTNLW